jgi:hypothetical protein
VKICGVRDRASSARSTVSEDSFHRSLQELPEDDMSEKKPELVAERFVVRICPVCGKRTYSNNGVHPQCAVRQADAPRQATLADAPRLERQMTHSR